MAEERLGASFSIDVTQLKAGLTQANRLIRESESEFKAASAGMDDFSKSQKGLEAKIKSLNKIQEIQEEKVKALQKQYDNLLEDGIDPTSAQMVKLRTDINNATAAVKKTISETEKYEKALENVGEETGDFEEATKKAEKTSGALDIAVGNLASNLVSSLGNALKDAVANLMNLADETREYREDIGKLETAWQSAGKSTEDATKLYKEFYSVLGEEDRSVEAVSHLAKLVDTEEDMAKWTDIATGVWGTFGDSLPIEGLTEAANETAKTGELTGVLTDALNWAAQSGETFGVKQKAATEANEEWNKSVEEAQSAEDYFRLALQECSTEQERQQLITETLNGLYSDAADKYRENNKSVIDARNATSEYNDIMAELGEKMEPANTAITELKTLFLKELTPAVKENVIPAITGFLDELKKDGTIKKFTKSISGIAKTVLPPLSKAVKFAAENIETLAGVTFTAVTVYKTFSAAMKVTSAITAAKKAIDALSAGTGVATIAQTGWNAAMAANPIGAVITAVSLLVSGISLLTSALGDTTKEQDYLSESQRQAVTEAEELTSAYKDTKDAADKLAESESSQLDYSQQLWKELQTLADESGKVKDADKGRAEYILNELNEALGTEYKMNGNIIQSYKDIKESIEDLIQTKKAQILLEAYEDSYVEAIKTRSQAEKDRTIQAQALFQQEQLIEQKRAEIEKYRELRDKSYDSKTRKAYNQKISNLEGELRKEEQTLKEKEDAYRESDATVKQVYQNIDEYETASALLLEGKTDEALSHLERLSDGYQSTAGAAGESKDEQLEYLKQQVIDTEVNLQILEAEYAAAQENMTEEEKKQAQARIEAAKQEAKDAKDKYYEVGGNLVEGMARGAEDGEWHLTGSLKDLVNNALSAAKKVLGIASPSKVFRKKIGLMIPLGVAGGVEDGTDAVVKSIKKQSDEIQNAYDLPNVSARVESGIETKDSQLSKTTNTVKSVNVYQTNNYSQAHSRYELYKVKQQTAAALKLALQGV